MDARTGKREKTISISRLRKVLTAGSRQSVPLAFFLLREYKLRFCVFIARFCYLFLARTALT